MINLEEQTGDLLPQPKFPGSPQWPGFGAEEPMNIQQEYAAQERALESRRLSDLFLDERKFAEIAESGEMRRHKRMSPLGDDLPKVGLNMAYLSHQAGRPVTSQDYHVMRNAFAASRFGKDMVTDGEFFDLVKNDYDIQSQKRAALDDLRLRLAARGLEDALAGKQTPAATTFNEWKAANLELVGGEEDLPYLAAAVADRNEFQGMVDKYKHLAAPGLDMLKRFTAGEATSDDLSDFAKQLAAVPREEQEKVIDLIAIGADAGQIDRGALKEFALAMGQTFARGFNFIPQRGMQDAETAFTEIQEVLDTGDVWLRGSGEASLTNVQRPGNTRPMAGVAVINLRGRKATPEEIEQLKTDARGALDVLRIERQLRAVADNNVDPIKRFFKGGVGGAIEGGFLGVAGSLPLLTATAVNPVAGALAYQSLEYNRMLTENPDMDVRAAAGIAMVEGSFQAAIDRLQLKTLQGALPVTGRLLGKIKSTGLRRTVGFAASGAEQFGQELIQDIGTLGMDAIASALREDMKDKSFTLELGEYWKQAPEVLVASLIFGMWGGGAITANELRGTPAEWDEAARMVGIGEQGRKRMRAAATAEELDAVVAREMASLTPDDRAAGALYAQQKLNAARAAQADPNEPTLEIVKDEAGDSLYRITTPEGETLIETKDAQAAQAAYLDYRTATQTNEVQALRETIDYWQNRDPELSIEQAPGVLVEEELGRLEGIGDAAGIARLRERLVAADIDPDSDLTGVQIFGSTTVEEVGENVYRGTILVRQGATPETVLEEVNHAFVRRALMRGDVTLDTLSGWLDQTATATGLDIKRGNEVEIIESIAQVGMDLFNGRLDQAQVPQGLVDYLRRLMRVVKEIYLRAVKVTEAFDRGEIDGNFEQFLMQSMGMDPQQQIDINSTTTAATVATGTDYSVGRGGQAMPDVTITPDEARAKGLAGPYYHGSPDFKGRKFTREHLGRNTGLSRSGISFTDDVSAANAYALEPMDSAQAAVDAANGVMREVAEEMRKGLKVKDPVTEGRMLEDASELPEFNVRYIDDMDEFVAYADYIADGLPAKLRDKLKAAARTANERPNPVVAEVYLRNPSEMTDVNGKKLWLVENPDDIFVSAARSPQGAATGGTRGQAMPGQDFSVGMARSSYLDQIDRTLDLPDKPESVETSPFEGGKVRTIAKLFQRMIGAQGRIEFGSLDEPGAQERVEQAGDRILEVMRRAAYEFPNFASWYESRLKMALDIFEQLDPDVAKEDNRAALLVVLAITSNGADVRTQTFDGWDVYRHWKKNGKLAGAPEKSGALRGKATENKLLAADKMAAALGGYAQLGQFLNRKGTVGELRKAMAEELGGAFTKDQINKLTNGELVSEVVPFSLVFGPKLGSFYNNMSGDFSTVTMDRWFMRTFGRAMGTQLAAVSRQTLADKDKRLREAIKPYKGDLLQRAGIRKGTGDPRKIAVALGKFFQKEENRSKLTKQEDEIRKAANDLFKVADGLALIEAPSTGTHRRWIRAVMSNALEKYNAQTDKPLVPAEAQALLWYYEKLVHETYGSRQKDSSPDYASSANQLYLRERGVRSDRFRDSDGIERRPGGGRSAAFGSLRAGSPQGVEDFSLGRPRVDQALASAMNRKPGERLAMYERAKEMFDRVAARRGESVGKFDLTLQNLWELDAILKVLPAEVRGKVGGFTQIAQLTTQEAVDKFLVKRLEMVGKQLDRYLANEYRIQLGRVLEATKPKKSQAGVQKSTLGPGVQAYTDKVRAAVTMDNDATAKRLADIEAELLKEETTDEQRVELTEEWGIVNTFGDLEHRNAETLAQALGELRETIKAGRKAWRTVEEARLAGQRAMVQSILKGLGDPTKAARFKDKGAVAKLGELLTAAGLDHATFEQFITAVIPDEAIAAKWSDALRRADNAAQDMELAQRKELMDAIKAAAKSAGMSKGSAVALLKRPSAVKVRALEGKQPSDGRVEIGLARKIVAGLADRGDLSQADVDAMRQALEDLPEDTRKTYVTFSRPFAGQQVEVTMTPAQAIQLELSWDQPDVQDKMRRDGWTDESIEDIRAINADPVAAATLAFLRDFYAKNYATVNPVYARMFGMNMPQAKFYAPSRYITQKNNQEVSIDGSPMVTGSTPGFAKSRVNHSAPIAPEDALTVFQQHVVQSAHWVNFAEFSREARAVTANREVREAIEQKYGEAVRNSLDAWVDQIQTRGANKSREITWMSRAFGSATGGTAISALGFSLKTVFIQADSAMRFALALDPRQIGSALSNPVALAASMPKIWFSPSIQRRLAGGMNPAVQFLFARQTAKPGALSNLAWLSMQPIQIFDAAATTLSSAMVFRSAFNDAQAAGMNDAQAEAVALDAMDAAIYRFSQPTGFGSKSNVENTGNAFVKMWTLFLSDPRLKTGVMLEAARNIAKGQNVGKSIQQIVAIEAMAVVSHVIASYYRDAFSDDEDEDIWSIEGFVQAIALAPLQGLFVAGTLSEIALRKMLGQQVLFRNRDPIMNTAEYAVRTVGNVDKLLDPEDPAEGLKAWNNALRGIALSTPLGAPAALLNIIKPFIGWQENQEAED